MKRFLAIALAALSMGFVVSAEARAADKSEQNSTTAQQYQRDRYYRRNNRPRTVRRSRIVRYGRRVYRETYLVTIWSNGRTTTRLIDRDRIS
jgi:hypothetical protein